MGLSRGSLIPIGAAGFAAFVTWNLLIEWPGGDPGKALDAAEYYDSIGKTVASSLGDLGPMLDSVWRDNSGSGINEFHAYLGSSIAPYTIDVSGYCGEIAEAYRNYAKLLSTTQRTLIAMALTNYLQLLFAGMWSWTGVGSAAMANALVDQMFRRIAAKTLIGELVKVLAEAVVRKLTGYLVGAALYSVGNQALEVVADEVMRVSPGSVHYNWDETFNNFIGCLPFWGLYDLSKVGVLAKVFPDNLLGNFGSFYIGSVAYTTVYNLLEGKSLEKALPQDGQWGAKVWVYLMQQSKPPAADPAPGTDPADTTTPKFLEPATKPVQTGTQPAGAQPGGTQPGGTSAGGTSAGGTQPGGTQGGGTQPGGTLPGGTQAGGTSAGGTQAGSRPAANPHPPAANPDPPAGNPDPPGAQPN
jgi:hypothetical protein